MGFWGANGPVVLTVLKDLLHGDLEGLLGSLGFLSTLLCLVECVDELDILEKWDSLVDGKRHENVIFELLELGILVSDLLHVLILGGLNLGSLLLHNQAEALFLQGLFCYAEVDHGGVGEDSSLEFGVGEPGGDEELELAVPVEFTVTDHDLLLLAYLDVVLADNVDQGRIQVLTDIFKKGSLSLGACPLDEHRVVLVLVIDVLAVLAALPLEPVLCLSLRVNDRAPLLTLGNQNGILS